MELLKFNDAPKSARRGKNPAGFIGAGIMVAVMGLSSTLAGTITLNTGQTVEFGQGVVTTAACDSSITVTPSSKFNASASDTGDSFTVSSVSISGIAGVITSGDSPCLGKVFEIRAYNGTTALELVPGGYGVTVAIPTTQALAIDSAKFVVNAWGLSGTALETTTSITAPGLTVTATDGTGADGWGFINTGTDSDNATKGATLTLTGLSISANITKITVESRSKRSGLSGNKEDSLSS